MKRWFGISAFGQIGIVLICCVAVSAFSPGTAHCDETLNYRLKWLYNVSTVGDLYALEHGFFEKQGLQVMVKAGGPERNAIRELELGYADFGVASADQVIRALAKGSPVVVLAQLFQINPLQWVYRSDQPPIERIGDLRGRNIGITYGGNDETIMRTLLAKSGLDEHQVQLSSVRHDFNPFFAGKVDIWPVYRNAQGPIIEAKLAKEGEGIRFFDPSRFGIRFVANSVVVSEKLLRERPAVAAAFTRGLLAAWRAAMDTANRERAIAVVLKYDPDTKRDLLEKQYDITRQLILPQKDSVLGAIDADAWRQTEDILLKQGQIAAKVNVLKALHPQWIAPQ